MDRPYLYSEIEWIGGGALRYKGPPLSPKGTVPIATPIPRHPGGRDHLKSNPMPSTQCRSCE